MRWLWKDPLNIPTVIAVIGLGWVFGFQKGYWGLPGLPKTPRCEICIDHDAMFAASDEDIFNWLEFTSQIEKRLLDDNPKICARHALGSIKTPQMLHAAKLSEDERQRARTLLAQIENSDYAGPAALATEPELDWLYRVAIWRNSDVALMARVESADLETELARRICQASLDLFDVAKTRKGLLARLKRLTIVNPEGV